MTLSSLFLLPLLTIILSLTNSCSFFLMLSLTHLTHLYVCKNLAFRKLHRSQTQDNKKGKKRNIIESSITPSSSPSTRTTHKSSSNARNHASKTNKSNTKHNKMIIDDNFGDGNNLSMINSAGCVGPSVVHSSSSTANSSSNNSSNSHTTSAQSTIVKLTPAQTSSGSARTSSPAVVNVSTLKKFTRDEPSTSRTPDMPSSFPGIKFQYEQQTTISTTVNQPTSLVINTNVPPMKESPPSSPGSEASAKKRRKQINSTTPQQSPQSFNTSDSNKEKDSKVVLQNGAIPIPTHHMLGNSLNPASHMAKTMSETLSMEIEQHAVHLNEATSHNYIGPQFPGRKDSVSHVHVNFLTSFIQLIKFFIRQSHLHRQLQQQYLVQLHLHQC